MGFSSWLDGPRAWAAPYVQELWPGLLQRHRALTAATTAM
jgi:hypothetical protein